MKILIADDSKLSRLTLENALIKLGHTVIGADSGEQAIQCFQQERPDLIILDVVMHAMSGFECATKLREMDKKNWIPIIFLSSSIDDENIAQGIDAGGDDYLTKPFSETTLSAKIRSMQRIADMRAELVETTRKLDILSSTDALTGLYNRLQFDKSLAETIAHASRHSTKFALLLIDVDHFKGINDTLGHNVGDLFLKEVARRLSLCLRIDDLIARLGGDEFAIIVRSLTSLEQAEIIACKITEFAEVPFEVEGHTLPITFSIGIACFPQDGTDRNTVMIKADKAMYRVKQAGRNNYLFFE